MYQEFIVVLHMTVFLVLLVVVGRADGILAIVVVSEILRRSITWGKIGGVLDTYCSHFLSSCLSQIRRVEF